VTDLMTTDGRHFLCVSLGHRYLSFGMHIKCVIITGGQLVKTPETYCANGCQLLWTFCRFTALSGTHLTTKWSPVPIVAAIHRKSTVMSF